MAGRPAEVMTPEQRTALSAIAPALEPGTYLAGGVAIGLTLRHRVSRDLDLFVPSDFEPERLAERLACTAAGVTLVGLASGTLHVEVGCVPVSVLAYRYPVLNAPMAQAGLPVPVASLDDLACMKLSAIAGRGAAKDFWDLEALLLHGVANGRLDALLELYSAKFGTNDVGHVVRALAYFGDADVAPLPRGLDARHWAALKAKTRRRVLAL